MLKPLSFVLSMSLFCLAAKGQQQYVLSGKLKKVPTGKIMLMHYNPRTEASAMDSADIKNGRFEFKGRIEGVEDAFLFLAKPGVDSRGNKTFDRQEFYLEKGKTSVIGATVATACIKGGAVQADNNRLQKKLAPYIQKEEELMDAYQSGGRAEAPLETASMRLQYKSLEAAMDSVKDKFVQDHPDAYLSMLLVKAIGAATIDPSVIEPQFNRLSQRLRNSDEGRAFQARIELAKKLAIGQPAIDFTLADTKGNPVSLSSLKGKYVLVDFWASWCGPCRAENPLVKKAYEKFKDKNFEIISVSLDEDKAKWIQAIEKDGLPWIHVSDLKGFKDKAALDYGVTAIPQNFLIDPNGIIVAKNMRGEQLEKTLEKIMEPKA